MRIDTATIREFFRAAGAPEPDLPWAPSAEEIARLAADAELRRRTAPVPDDLSELSRRRAAR